MSINFPAFLQSLTYMLEGMVGVFAVIGIILLCTLGLNAVFKGKD